MNKKYLGIALVAILVIAASVSYFSKGENQISVGAVPTLDAVDHPFVSINGLRTWHKGFPMNATSSYICAVQNPYGATTTIQSVGAISLQNGIAEANALYISTSTSAFGTSTPALVSAFAMGTGQWNVELEKNTATTTLAAAIGGTTGDTTLLPGRTPKGASNYILGPREWITWKIATTTGGTYGTYNVGLCTAELKRF